MAASLKERADAARKEVCTQYVMEEVEECVSFTDSS
jgi:hypothetical protein